MWQRFDCFTKNMLMTVEDVDELNKSLFEMTPLLLENKNTDKNGNTGREVIRAQDVTLQCSSRSSTAKIIETANSIIAKVNESAILNINSSSISMSTGGTSLLVSPSCVSIGKDLRVSNSTYTNTLYTNNLYVGGIEIRTLIAQICNSIHSQHSSLAVRSSVETEKYISVKDEKDIKIEELEERIKKLEKIIEGDKRE